MKALQRTRFFLALLLSGYFLIGIATRATGEIFPVWSWFLFAAVPQRQTHYSALLLEVEGANLSEPMLYQDGKDIIPSPNSPTAAVLLDRLGKALESKDAEATTLRQTLETNYLPRVKRYAIVKLSYRPLEYWRTRAHERKEIATFEVTTR
ncbi:hypothetical protein [Polyangium sp. 15x6]|uniref:hypothetical protein n=1 Tax=Polyangium sp. 15x6 TaxID=3042687 RepID=UPI00249C965E|nr:hypothetical protein [Polyangium sp. 15x6]MDI3289316.1 hypothetical protein [Polyangium sp. 15x6]